MVCCFVVAGFCDFEQSDLCGYTQDKKDDFDWTRTQKSTDSVGTGPATDHTYGTGQGRFEVFYYGHIFP